MVFMVLLFKLQDGPLPHLNRISSLIHQVIGIAYIKYIWIKFQYWLSFIPNLRGTSWQWLFLAKWRIQSFFIRVWDAQDETGKQDFFSISIALLSKLIAKLWL